ncbi:MAG: N-acetylmuramic acid 6-phosphate etherase [Spirochaetales bacterium]|nr:N-acetylmuramic acid 6-phosphate etherase [Spirochaetales bacterium]
MQTNINTTEQRNSVSYKIDTKTTTQILEIMNSEDKLVPIAVGKAIAQIANVVDAVVDAFNNNGRLFYIGAGTSGRLGVLDASECPPTFGVSPTQVQGIIAGGNPALTRSIECAEDDGEQGIEELKKVNFSSLDVLVGITASGGASFVVDALKYAKSLGAKIGAISCNNKTQVFDIVGPDYSIYLPVGPEIVTGSTRLKSGTGQKLVLNMITTTAMIRTGKVYNNLMVNVMPVNKKLVDRSCRLIQEVTSVDYTEAQELFKMANKEVKTAIVMKLLNVDAANARIALANNGGSINRVLDEKR